MQHWTLGAFHPSPAFLLSLGIAQRQPGMTTVSLTQQPDLLIYSCVLVSSLHALGMPPTIISEQDGRWIWNDSIQYSGKRTPEETALIAECRKSQSRASRETATSLGHSSSKCSKHIAAEELELSRERRKRRGCSSSKDASTSCQSECSCRNGCIGRRAGNAFVHLSEHKLKAHLEAWEKSLSCAVSSLQGQSNLE